LARGPQRPLAQHPAVAAALRDCRRAFWSVGLSSGVVNILMLAGPLYMLQIYDRVLASHGPRPILRRKLRILGFRVANWVTAGSLPTCNSANVFSLRRLRLLRNVMRDRQHSWYQSLPANSGDHPEWYKT
jgi:hypothetical protein